MKRRGGILTLHTYGTVIKVLQASQLTVKAEHKASAALTVKYLRCFPDPCKYCVLILILIG